MRHPQLDTVLDGLLASPTERGRPALDASRALAERLGRPQDHARPVHVVGTAGKGTVAYAVTAALVAAGRRVSTHMSPHVFDVRERFLLDARPAAADLLDDAVADLVSALDGADPLPTYFAATAALSWLIGRRAGAGVQVTEAGIGGRLDATNIIDRPDKITVVTAVDLDHRDVLGPDVAAIATEKAAVITPGGVVVIGPQPHRDAAAVIEAEARRRGARAVAVAPTGDWRLDAAAVTAAVVTELGLAPPPPGPAPLPPGRGQVVERGGAVVVLDGAHNPAKLAALFASLPALLGTSGPAARTGAVVALGEGKDLGGCADVLSRHVSWVAVTAFGEVGSRPRSHSPDDVATALADRGVRVVAVDPDPGAAAARARRSMDEGDVLVVTGSFLHLAAALEGLG